MTKSFVDAIITTLETTNPRVICVNNGEFLDKKSLFFEHNASLETIRDYENSVFFTLTSVEYALHMS